MKKLKGIVKRTEAAGLAAMLFISQADVSALAGELTEVPESTEVSELSGFEEEPQEETTQLPVSGEIAPETGEQPAGGSEISSWADLQAQLAAGGEITLSRDYESEGTDTGLEIPSGKTVTLDLNDHYILYKGTGNASVITVNGTLTLKDSKTTGKTTRYVTLNAQGRAESVDTSGTVSDTCIKVTGGFIAGGNNESNRGGGVYVQDSCMFTMEGGTIVG